MKLFFSEFKKLAGISYLWIILCVLLAVSAAVAYVGTYPSEKVMDGAELVEFYSEYENNRDEIDRRIDAASQERINEFYATGIMPEEVSFYTASPYHNDSYLRDSYTSQEKYTANFHSDLRRVVRAAEMTMEEYDYYGVSDGEYEYRYQESAAEIYTRLGDAIEPELIYPDSWESYFQSPYVNIFLFIAVIVIADAVFLYEKDCRAENIIRTAKRGRTPVLMSKLGCIALCVLAVTVLFSAVNLAVYVYQGGLTSPGAPLQSLPDFEYCPVEITLGQFVLVQLLFRFSCALAFAYLTAAVSLAVRNHVLTYTLSAIVFGLNAFVSSLYYENISSPLRCFNLYNTASAGRFFNRYIAQNIFGSPVNSVYVCAAVYMILVLLMFTLCAVLYSMNPGGIRLPALSRKKKSSSVAARPARVRTGNVFLWELKKTFTSPKIIVFVLCILAVRFAVSSDTLTHHKYFEDEIFRHYMNQLSGEATEEKFASVEAKRAEIDEILSSYERQTADFKNGEMSSEEYGEYLQKFYSAQNEDRLFKPVEERASYLRGCIDETGVRVHFVYDTGINKLLCGDADLFLYVAIVVLLTQTFVIEYGKSSSNGGFSQILRTTALGRGRTFAAKLASSAAVCALLSIICSAADILILAKNYDLSAVMPAPLLSLPSFAGVSSRLTVFQYTGFMMICRLASAVLLSVIVCSASALFRQYVPVLTSVGLVTLIPHVIGMAGMERFYSVSFISLFDVNKLFDISSRADFAGDFTFFAIFAACALAACAALCAAAYRRFAK